VNSDQFGKGNGAFVALFFCTAIVLAATLIPRIVPVRPAESATAVPSRRRE
jgi:hypothetical protein